MSSPSRDNSAQKRAFLIERAARCLAERGYARTSLRDIAQEAGVSLGILHYYFANKEELLLEVMQVYKEELLGGLERELDADVPDRDPLHRLLSVLKEWMVRHADLHRLWYDLSVQALYVPAFRVPVESFRERHIRFLAQGVARLVPPQTLGEAGWRPETLAVLIYAAMDSLFFHALLSAQAEPEAAFRRFERAVKEIVFPLLGRTQT